MQTDAKHKAMVPLGTITADHPTVSHLLINHPDYASKCWQIIHAEVNAQKPYTQIQKGTQIAYNPDSQEISWGVKNPRTQTKGSGATNVKNDMSSVSAPKAAGQDLSSQFMIDQSVSKASAKYGLAQDLIKGVIQAESNFQPQAVSPAGAKGLMQLMPGTAKELGVKNPFDIAENIDAGSRYLKKMLTLFNGDLTQALAAYNAGPQRIKDAKGEIPFHETRRFVQRVLSFSGLLA